MRHLIAPTIALVITVLAAAAPAAAAELTIDVIAHHRASDPVTVDVSVEGAETYTASIESPGTTVLDVAPGSWTVTASAEGFDAESVDLAVEAARWVPVSLFPAADVAFRGTVALATGGAASSASIRISGGRLEAARTVTTDPAGSFEALGIPAGYYDVDVTTPGGAHVSRLAVDVLGDTTMAFVLPDVNETPRSREFRRFGCTTARGGVGASLLLALGLIALRRR